MDSGLSQHLCQDARGPVLTGGENSEAAGARAGPEQDGTAATFNLSDACQAPVPSPVKRGRVALPEATVRMNMTLDVRGGS